LTSDGGQRLLVRIKFIPKKAGWQEGLNFYKINEQILSFK
jgi:hypothetical protein